MKTNRAQGAAGSTTEASGAHSSQPLCRFTPNLEAGGGTFSAARSAPPTPTPPFASGSLAKPHTGFGSNEELLGPQPAPPTYRLTARFTPSPNSSPDAPPARPGLRHSTSPTSKPTSSALPTQPRLGTAATPLQTIELQFSPQLPAIAGKA